ncbi:hypothetical protein B0H63DRAFT_8821 [Podospora didyma]|uniref:Uncharacterized protein n=1 Tax=Podospora didyma TaxID=330526 RepID=A0AAE0P4D6_9PEZI|nr:hypothetical protein B0H63DRAFT_8821 [Podospora didyma]
MSKNSSITSFFKPIAKNSQDPQSPLPQAPRSHVPPSPTPLPPLLSSSPPAPVSAVRGRDIVIRGSDEEDDNDDFISSSDDLPSLFTKPRNDGAMPAAPARNNNLCVTPRAKRKAVAFHSSPLTIMPKHKFDFQALLKHAQVDNAVDASEKRIASILSSEKKAAAIEAAAAASSTSYPLPSSRNQGHASLHDTMLDVFSDADGSQDESRREKLLRAVKRTESTVHRKEYRFFDQSVSDGASIEARAPFPKEAATGVWTLLAPANNRDMVFEDGVPYHIQHVTKSLPDKIYLWILTEAPKTRPWKLRKEYIKLLGECPDQARRVMDEGVIIELFQNLGASKQALVLSAQTSLRLGQSGSSGDRDWTPLQTALQILRDASYGLENPALTLCVSILLRLGMDNIVRKDLTVERDYQDALHLLVESVSRDFRSWDSFCGDVGDSLYHHVEEACLRWDAVSSIPLMSPRLIDLRRRLAIVFVFDDPQRARARPEDNFSMRAVMDRLEADEFIVDRNYTDFYELAALALLLGVAIGDGNPPTGGKEAINQYNAEVDEVARRLKIMHCSINVQGPGFASRLDARTSLEDLERKLEYVVRTRPRPKTNIFGIEQSEDKTERPKQELFMKKFFAKDRPPKTP